MECAESPGGVQQAGACVVSIDQKTRYFTNVDEIRRVEYPTLADTTYLDHAGTTPYAKSAIDAFAKDLSENLFGNPHSAAASSQLSSRRIDDVRLEVLRFFGADPDHFDIVFVANATAAIKLVADAFRDHDHGFQYYYHGESHTSLVGVRELATGARCFATDQEAELWLEQCKTHPPPGPALSLFAYPAQSNMTGRRLPLRWCEPLLEFQGTSAQRVFTLLDAAALASTAPLHLSPSQGGPAPDFTVVSFYKIFGFPDLGALIVKKACAPVLRGRRYFGGGTVDLVTVLGDAWHASKTTALHSALEDGTLPFHSIVALQSALAVHRRLYGSMSNISAHAHFLAATLRARLDSLCHANGQPASALYTGPFDDMAAQGPVVAFNLKDAQGRYLGNAEVDKLATVRAIQFRTGGLCNPGGVAHHLALSPAEMRHSYASGHRCGGDIDVIGTKPMGAIRVSFGAMSNLDDVARLVSFLQEFYVESTPTPDPMPMPMRDTPSRIDVVSVLPPLPSFVVESLSVFPIKSCGAYRIPAGVAWEVLPQGLAWDREWCIIHQGSAVALSQKRFPRMTLIRPQIDLVQRTLTLSYGTDADGRTLLVDLDWKPATTSVMGASPMTHSRVSNVCGDEVIVHVYTSPHVAEFFSHALMMPCTLARFGPQDERRPAKVRPSGRKHGGAKPIALSNESPMLLVSRSSVNRLNEDIKRAAGLGRAVAADSFRANVVVAERRLGGQLESPYAEDQWTSVQIGPDRHNVFEFLGPCQRCQMVCVDQQNAQRRPEPFSTLAKTRRREGRVWFGMHMCLQSPASAQNPPVFLRVGDEVVPQLVD